MFSLKQWTKSILSATIEKNQIFTFQENSLIVLWDKELQWVNVKQKPFRPI